MDFLDMGNDVPAFFDDSVSSPAPWGTGPLPVSELQNGVIMQQVNKLLTGFFPMIQGHIDAAILNVDGKVNLIASFMDKLNADVKTSISSIQQQLHAPRAAESDNTERQHERDQFQAQLAQLQAQLTQLQAQNKAREAQDNSIKSTTRRAHEIVVEFKTIEERVGGCIMINSAHLSDRLGMVEGQFDTHARKFEELSIRCDALEASGRELIDHIAHNAVTQSEACARRHKTR